MKTINGFICTIALAFLSLAGCVSKPQPISLNKAEVHFENVWNKYRIPKHQLFSEYYPNSFKPDLSYFQDSVQQAKEVSFLWPMSGVFSTVNVMMELDSAKYKPYLDSMVIAVEKYYDNERLPPGYQAYPKSMEYSDRYYDDNGLVGIDYVDAYQVTGNSNYLDKAKEVMTFIQSGWRDDFGGGVSWLEGVHDQKPACSNGKATVLALKLYQATESPEYLEYGIRYYNWMMNTLKDDSLNIIWNSLLIRDDSCWVQKHAYTYNTGTMIQSAVRLYKITKDDRYLKDARQLAEGSYQYYVKFTDQNIPYIDDLPWFVVVLFRGYHELYEVDGNPKYIDAIIASANYAWENARDEEGLVFRDWTGRNDESQQPKWLLDEVCMAEVFARILLLRN